MLVSSYNNQAFDDLLVVLLENAAPDQQNFERKGDITEIKDKKSGNIVGYNFFKATQWLADLDASGPVTLSEEQVATLNEALKAEGFAGDLVADTAPKFVVGHVKECVPHPDSDHLSLTEVEIDNGEVLQIVCGASNVAQGQKVVVAKPGAVMPDGLVIWPGELRGETSNGMLSSAHELGVDVSEEKQKGILILEDDAEVGSEFTF